MIITLEPKKLPEKWYNILPDLGFAVPPPLTGTGHHMGKMHLADIATSEIIEQELEDNKRDIRIPEKVRELYSEFRPTPLYRAERWEKSLGTPARIFYKYEGGNSAGTYEANTAIPQAYYAADQGVKSLVTATSTGEMGISLAVACNYFNLKCKVYMVRSAYEEKAYGRYIMELLGAEVVPSPSRETDVGKKSLAEDPESVGSLGVALSEAFEHTNMHEDAKFCWGTVMNHVLLHQTVIGQEARAQMREVKAYPDAIIGAVGGGSAFGGLAFPFYRDRKNDTRMIAVETAAVPSLSKGTYRYDYADAAGMTALYKMYTLGRKFVPPGIRAGGMRYHGISPIISAMYREEVLETRIHTQTEAFKSAVDFARAEGIIPSPESSYALKAVVDEALICKESGKRKDILFVLTGNGNLDVATFKDFLDGSVADQPFSPDEAAMGELLEGSSDAQ